MEQRDAIGKRIQDLMEQKGLNYNTLAEKSGVPLKRVYRLANSMNSNPSVFLMMQICDGLGVSLDEFFGAEEFKEFHA